MPLLGKFRLLLIGLVALLSAGFLQGPKFETATIDIKSDNNIVSFVVELADTPVKHKKGLMRRESLAPDHGMLFIFDREKRLSFWMRNTPLSLDIIFFDQDGVYVNHHANTQPFSENSLKSTSPAQYALEVNAGLAKAKSIGEGSVLILPEQLR